MKLFQSYVDRTWFEIMKFLSNAASEDMSESNFFDPALKTTEINCS